MKFRIILKLFIFIIPCAIFSSCYGSGWTGESSIKNSSGEAVIYSVSSRNSGNQGYQISIYSLEGRVIAKKFIKASVPLGLPEGYEPGASKLARIVKFDKNKVIYQYKSRGQWFNDVWEWVADDVDE